jgi:hypothetical protein
MFGFFCAVMAYIGVIRLQIKLYRSGELTEGIFVLFQVSILSLLIVFGSLALLPSFKEQSIGIGISVLFWFVGIPAARWFYKKYLLQK